MSKKNSPPTSTKSRTPDHVSFTQPDKIDSLFTRLLEVDVVVALDDVQQQRDAAVEEQEAEHALLANVWKKAEARHELGRAPHAG